MPPPPFGSLFAAREGGRGAHHDVGLGAPPPARRGFEPVCGRSGADDVGRASIGPNRASVSSGCSWRSDDDREGAGGGLGIKKIIDLKYSLFSGGNSPQFSMGQDVPLTLQKGGGGKLGNKEKVFKVIGRTNCLNRRKITFVLHPL